MQVHEIFHAIQSEGQSLAMARRQVGLENVRFNEFPTLLECGELVTSMTQEFDVQEGSTFQIGNRNWVRKGGKWIRNRKMPWASNMIQFPRLLAEIAATQNLELQDLADSMDLEVSDVCELLERARVEWEIIKKKH